jgi:hypothetical protein
MAAPRSPETLAFLDRERLVPSRVEADGNCLIGSILAALGLRQAWLPGAVRQRLADALRCLFEELPEAADLLQELLLDGGENQRSPQPPAAIRRASPPRRCRLGRAACWQTTCSNPSLSLSLSPSLSKIQEP